MRGLRNILFAIIFSVASVGVSAASDIYVAQNAAGGNSGADCADAHAVAWLNTAANWGAGSNQIGPGTVVHLCGTITTGLNIQGSGTPGNVIEFLAEPGSSIQVPNGNSYPVALNNNSHLLFDGGGPGGTNGIIAVLNNGSGLATQVPVSAFGLSTTSGDIEIRNWMIGPLYQHTSATDTTNNADTGTSVFYANGLSGDLSIHDNVIHDVGWAIQILNFTGGPRMVSVYNNYFYNHNHALAFGGTTGYGGTFYLLFHDNHVGSTKNWDTTNDAFHHDGIHLFPGDASASLGTFIYNNLFDGDWGSCCATSFIFTDWTGSGSVDNLYIYNNLFNQHAGNAMPLVEVTPTRAGGIYNNTFQCGAGSTLIEGLQVGVMPTGLAASGTNIENNAFYNCNTFVNFVSNTTLPGKLDYNVYMAEGAGGNNAWGIKGGTSSNTFSTWQAGSSADTDSIYSPTDFLNLDGTLLPTFPGSPTGAKPGVNLTSIATGNLAALTSDTSDGNARTPVARPSTGAWAVGAYEGQSTASGQLVAPTGLTAAVQ